MFKVLAVSDDRDFCECCGKTGLKRVVWIENTETGDIKHFGTTCAASPVKGFGLDKEIKSRINQFKDVQDFCWKRASHQYKAEGGTYTTLRNPLRAVADNRPRLEAIFNEIWEKNRIINNLFSPI